MASLGMTVTTSEEPKVCELGIITENLMEKMLRDGQKLRRVVISLIGEDEFNDPTTSFVTGDYRRNSVLTVLKSYRDNQHSENYPEDIIYATITRKIMEHLQQEAVFHEIREHVGSPNGAHYK